MSAEGVSGAPLICLVDDEIRILAAISAALRSRGDYNVVVFDRAQSFLGFAGAHLTRCLVTDYRMPEMSGSQLVREVRRRGWSFPVIVSSAVAETAMRRVFLGLDVAAFIDKSAGPDALMRAIVGLVRSPP